MTTVETSSRVDRFCMLVTEKERLLSVLFVYNNCSCIESMIITLRVLDRFLVPLPPRAVVKTRKRYHRACKRTSTQTTQSTSSSSSSSSRSKNDNDSETQQQTIRNLPTTSICDQHTLFRLLTVIAVAVEKFIGVDDSYFGFYHKTFPFDSVSEVFCLERLLLDMIEYSIPWIDPWLLFYENHASELHLTETMILVAQMRPSVYTFDFFEAHMHLSDRQFDQDTSILRASKSIDFLRCLKITYDDDET